MTLAHLPGQSRDHLPVAARGIALIRDLAASLLKLCCSAGAPLGCHVEKLLPCSSPNMLLSDWSPVDLLLKLLESHCHPLLWKLAVCREGSPCSRCCLEPVYRAALLLLLSPDILARRGKDPTLIAVPRGLAGEIAKEPLLGVV